MIGVVEQIKETAATGFRCGVEHTAYLSHCATILIA
jgi:hypothetical protein